MDKQKALNLLLDTHQVLKDMGIKHFVTDGTLLGALRGADFIDHDADLDIGVFIEEFNRDIVVELFDELSDKNIKSLHSFGSFPEFFELAFKRDGIKIDIFFYREHKGNYIFHAFRNGGKNLPDDVITYYYPKRMLLSDEGSLNEVLIRGERFPAPANPYSFVQHKYGEDWAIPIKDWDWADAPNNKISQEYAEQI